MKGDTRMDFVTIDKELNDRIYKAIEESGYKRCYIASKLNLKVNSLRRKTKGERKWTREELEILEKILNKKII